MEQAIAALLTEPNHAAAAEKAGIGHTTLTRWLRLPVFKRAYRRERRRILQLALSRLTGIVEEAVSTLKRALTCGHSAVEVRAALGIIDQAVKSSELLALQAELEQIKKLLADQKARG
jgi:hypothetical protein